MSYRFFICIFTASAVVLCLASIPVVAQTEASVPAANKATDNAHSATTPRTAGGKPDLSGLWVPAASFHLILRKDAAGRPSKILFPAPDADFSKGDAAARARRAADPNQPPYKPELLAKVKYLDENTNQFDGVLHCQPAGVPRIGPPQQIVQTSGQVL